MMNKNDLTDKEALAEAVDLFGEDVANNKVSQEEIEAMAEGVQELLSSADFDLDKALDSYDPTFPRYTPSVDAFEFFSLMRLVQGSDFEFDTPVAHYFMVDLLLGAITDPMVFPYSKEVCSTIYLDPNRVGIMASRGLAKSTVGISFFAVYSAIKGELPNGIGKVYFYLLIAASSKGGARVNALAVRAMCEDSVFLKDFFEDMRFTETETEFIRKGNGPKKNRSFLIRYQGYSTGIRGSRYGERRPDLIGFDDAILNTAAAYSKVMSENLDEIIHSDSINALKGGGKGRVVLYFTPFHYNDVNTKALIQGAFTQCVMPMARAFDPEKKRLSPTDIESSWESMHPSKSIVQLVRGATKSKKLKLFLQERMLRLTSGADRLIPDSCIQFCDTAVIEDNIAGYSVYITTDYTTTSGEDSDFSGVAVWAVSNNEDYFLLALHLRKMGMEEQYTVTLDEADKWKRKGKFVEIGVEVDGSQGSHIFALEKKMIERGTWHSFAKQKGDIYSTRKGILSKATGVKKHERFRMASLVMLRNKIWFPEHLKDTADMKELIQQIKGATHTSFTRADDGPDLITMLCVSMHVIPPTEAHVPTNEDSRKVLSDDGSYFYDFQFKQDKTSAYDSY